MDTFIGLVVITVAVFIFLYFKNKKVKEFIDARIRKPVEASKPEVSTPTPTPVEKPTVEAPVKPETPVVAPVTKPNPVPTPESTWGPDPRVLGGFRTSAEVAAILDARMRDSGPATTIEDYPKGLPHIITKADPTNGGNRIVAFGPTRQLCFVEGEGHFEINSAGIAGAVKTYQHFELKDLAGQVIAKSADVVDTSHLGTTLSKGPYRLEWWSDEPVTCWVVFKL